MYSGYSLSRTAVFPEFYKIERGWGSGRMTAIWSHCQGLACQKFTVTALKLIGKLKNLTSYLLKGKLPS